MVSFFDNFVTSEDNFHASLQLIFILSRRFFVGLNSFATKRMSTQTGNQLNNSKSDLMKTNFPFRIFHIFLTFSSRTIQDFLAVLVR